MSDVFSAPYSHDDVALAEKLLAQAKLSAEAETEIEGLAARLVESARTANAQAGGVEALLHKYPISNPAGLALMMLAETFLRVHDISTADLLIADKIKARDFSNHSVVSTDVLEIVSAFLLHLTASLTAIENNTENILARLTKRLGQPAVRAGVRQTMRLIANHFVLGETIPAALERAKANGKDVARYSFDMLGEAARTQADAEKYFQAYALAIREVGEHESKGIMPFRPGISVKLSALHPRFEARQRARVCRELVPVLLELAKMARDRDLQFMVDAEEADRLELSLDVVRGVVSHPSLQGWDGFGMAVQAYQKRAHAVIDWVASLAEGHHRRLCIRLVKGAYWDTEIKRAQERGLDEFPVFTRKAMTDLNYVNCAERMLELSDRIFPQFATHNALTIASIVQRTNASSNFEFQRLHGMGTSLYRALESRFPGLRCRTYAPVGGHRDLLAYLVRRLLENGANSSFVAVSRDGSVPIHAVVGHPADILGDKCRAMHADIRLPRDLFLPHRINSRGIEFGHWASIDYLLREITRQSGPVDAAPICNGTIRERVGSAAISPIDGRTVFGHITNAGKEIADEAVAAAAAGLRSWQATPPKERAVALERTADFLEQGRARLIHLLQVEAGKTLDDAIAEAREAVDFCRFYAAEGWRLFQTDRCLPGPVGEDNDLRFAGRGVFVAISPWNFPLAIFIGQVSAALMAGNTVVAKPAEQTPCIAFEAVRLLHQAGIPETALHFVPGDGSIGAHLVSAAEVAGVVFTGSTEVARLINRQLAAKDGPIVPLIAETGGINAMIVDATALPEQVADDVTASSFRSAGQRCSALRVLYLQEDVADQIIEKVVGSTRELTIGDPRSPATDIGPVIDSEARAALLASIEDLRSFAKLLYQGVSPEEGNYVAPHIFERPIARKIDRELFGPILQIVRYSELGRVLDDIKQTQYGLTLGIHSRIDSTVDCIVNRHLAGNVYVNRNMIGAVVGSQPFGGHGLSGTGPKAGGCHYLLRFANEETVSVNTAAAGGNAALMAISQ